MDVETLNVDAEEAAMRELGQETDRAGTAVNRRRPARNQRRLAHPHRQNRSSLSPLMLR